MEYCFYLDWRGLTPSEWAAWAQAVGSVVAILVSVWIPMWHQKRDLRRQVSNYVRMVGLAKSIAVSNARQTSEWIGNLADPQWVNGEWDLLIASLKGVEYHQLPDFGLFVPLQDSLRDAELCRTIMIAGSAAAEKTMPITAVMANDLRACAGRLTASHRQAAYILSGYGGRGPLEYLRWRYHRIRRWMSARRVLPIPSPGTGTP